MKLPFDFDEERIGMFCRKNRILSLSVFGSALREDFRRDSDVDVLVVFEPGHEPGFMGLAGMERELSVLLGRKVDMRTPEDLSELFRDEVISRAETMYAA